jgi:hypothetical protein
LTDKLSADPLHFIADLLNENFDTQLFYSRNSRVPNIYMSRWMSTEDTEFPAISIFSHQQTADALGFEGKNYLNIRQVRVEMRTDNLEELHIMEEEIQRVVGQNSSYPHTATYPDPKIEFIRVNSSVDVFESVTDVLVYRRSLLIDCFTQYAYT